MCALGRGNVGWDGIDRPECAVIYPVNEAIRNCDRRPSSLIRAERQLRIPQHEAVVSETAHERLGGVRAVEPAGVVV